MSTTKRTSAFIVSAALLCACSSDNGQAADARSDGSRRDTGPPADHAGFDRAASDGRAGDSTLAPDGRRLPDAARPPDAASPPDGVRKPDTLRDDAGAACGGVADCRLFSDYCDGCHCRVLGAQEPDPKCAGTIVSCFMDPCTGLQAACVDHRCVAK